MSPTTRRNSTFSRARTRTSWAAPPTRARKLRLGGDGHIVVWGGVSLWRSLMRLDLIDELQLSLFPYGGEGSRLFDGVPKSYRLDLVSSTASSNGILELQYRRHRNPAAQSARRLRWLCPRLCHRRNGLRPGSSCWPWLSDCDAGHDAVATTLTKLERRGTQTPAQGTFRTLAQTKVLSPTARQMPGRRPQGLPRTSLLDDLHDPKRSTWPRRWSSGPTRSSRRSWMPD